MANQGNARATLYVCRSCVWSETKRERDGKRQGQFLLDAMHRLLDDKPLPKTLGLRGVFCLNGCKSPCNVGYRAAGKYHLRFSRLTSDNAAEVLALAGHYLASADGDIADEHLPATLRDKLTVRAPPLRPRPAR